MDTPTFIQNMAVILVAVGIISVLFSRLGWPRAIGYIFAGVLLGKYTWGGSLITVDATDTINVLGQMGVLFLMFTLGLEFSLPKLKSIGGVALPTALLDVLVMVWAGHFIGVRFLGLSTVGGLFLGAAICDSATTVLAKTIGDLGWGKRRFTGYVMGITMTEDLFCVAIIALLSGVARNHGIMDFSLVASSLGGLSLFLVGVLVFGILLVPRVVNWVGRLRDDESLLLCMLGICFLVAFIAIKLEYGVALGAFLVGMMGAESNVLRRIYRQSVALRSMFSAIFFVTIGLMVDPSQLWMYRYQILVVSAVVVVGKTLNCTLGSLLAGQGLKDSLQTGMGLAQIGEFALIVAYLGIQLHVFDEKSMFYPVVVGVSLSTTILNAALIRLSDPLSDLAVRCLPVRWRSLLETYDNWVVRFHQQNEPGKTRAAIRFNFIISAVLLLLEAAIFIAAGMLENASFLKMLPKTCEGHETTLLWIAALLLTIPCSICFFYRARALGTAVADFLIPSRAEGTLWAAAFRKVVVYLVLCVALVALFAESAMFSNTLLPENTFEKWLILGFIIAIGVVGWTRFRHMGGDAMETLRIAMTRDNGSTPTENDADLLDIHTERLQVGMNASICGRSLREINLRARTGVSVIGIDRKGRSIVNPRADEKIEFDDRVILLGDDEQIDEARRLLSGPFAS